MLCHGMALSREVGCVDRRLVAVVVMLILLGLPLLTTDLMEESAPPDPPEGPPGGPTQPGPDGREGQRFNETGDDGPVENGSK